MKVDVVIVEILVEALVEVVIDGHEKENVRLVLPKTVRMSCWKEGDSLVSSCLVSSAPIITWWRSEML